MRRIVPLSCAAAAALALAPAAAQAAVALLAADGGGGAAGVTVTHVGNAGVLLTAGGRRVLVDALFGAGLADYSTVPPARRAAMESARGDFAGVDLVLATHAHADHFDAGAVARHLLANERARFVSTPEAVAAVRATASGAAIADRTHATLPDVGAHETLRHGGITVTVVQLHHGRGLSRPVANLGFLVEIGGRSIVHLGDTEVDAHELAAAHLDNGRIDLALVPFWRLVGADDRAAIRAALRPARVVALHVPPPGASDDLFGAPGGRAALETRMGAPASGVSILDEQTPLVVLAPSRGK